MSIRLEAAIELARSILDGKRMDNPHGFKLVYQGGHHNRSSAIAATGRGDKCSIAKNAA
jgi:hypothetical protein